MKVSCLGPGESYSCLAAKRFRSDATFVCCKSFKEVIDNLKSGEADFAVIPVSNCITGSIVKNLDLITETEGVMGVESFLLPVEHRLVTKGNIPYENIERVCSHVQALGQCEKFIQANFPNARLVVTRSTAESLSLLDIRRASSALTWRATAWCFPRKTSPTNGRMPRVLCCSKRERCRRKRAITFSFPPCADMRRVRLHLCWASSPSSA